MLIDENIPEIRTYREKFGDYEEFNNRLIRKIDKLNKEFPLPNNFKNLAKNLNFRNYYKVDKILREENFFSFDINGKYEVANEEFKKEAKNILKYLRSFTIIQDLENMKKPEDEIKEIIYITDSRMTLLNIIEILGNDLNLDKVSGLYDFKNSRNTNKISFAYNDINDNQLNIVSDESPYSMKNYDYDLEKRFISIEVDYNSNKHKNKLKKFFDKIGGVYSITLNNKNIHEEINEVKKHYLN